MKAYRVVGVGLYQRDGNGHPAKCKIGDKVELSPLALQDVREAEARQGHLIVEEIEPAKPPVEKKVRK